MKWKEIEIREVNSVKQIRAIASSGGILIYNVKGECLNRFVLVKYSKEGRYIDTNEMNSTKNSF